MVCMSHLIFYSVQPLMRNKNTKHIEIVGFGEEEIQKYASCAFESKTGMLKSFTEYLSDNPVVKSMMYNPLNCSIITKVYQATSETGRPISHTQTQLYTEITLWRLSRYLRTNDHNAKIPRSVDKVPSDNTLYQQVVKMIRKLPNGEDLYQHLVKLGKLALEGRQKETVIYDDVATYNFFHLTMQEYMSAFYIAQLPADEQRSHFRNSVHTMNVVWQFVAGLTKMKRIGWDTVYGGSRRTLFVEYAFEAQDIQSVCDQHIFKSREVEYASSELSSYAATALGYCISGLNCSWNLQLANLSEISVKMLENGMHMNDDIECSGSIVTLQILYSPGIMEHLLHWSQLHTSPRNKTLKIITPRNIKTLRIINCKVDNSGFCDFARCIPYLENLISLDIGENIGYPASINTSAPFAANPKKGAHPDYSSGLVKVIEALKKHRHLKSLAMSSIGYLGAEEGEALLNLVQSKECCLTELKINASNVHNVIPWILTQPTSLKSLSIDEMTIDHLHDVDHLSDNISTLYLHSSYAPIFRDSGRGLYIISIGNIIKKNKSLKELGLDISINEDGVRYILQSLSTNTTLVKLMLRKWGHFDIFSEDERETIDPRVEFLEYSLLSI